MKRISYLIAALALSCTMASALAGGDYPTHPTVDPSTTQTLSNKTLTNAGSVTAAAGNAATFQHYLSNGTGPTLSASTGAGTSPTLSLIFGTDTSGLIQLTTGSSPAAASAAVIITYNQSFPGQAVPILIPGNAAAMALSGSSKVFTDSLNNGTGSWRIMSGASALAAGTVYKWWYFVAR